MRIIFLNIYHSKVNQKGIKEYLQSNTEKTDIFCFQEFDKPTKNLIDPILSGFQCFTNYKNLNEERFGNAEYIKRNLEIRCVRNLTEDSPDLPPASLDQINVGLNKLSIVNCHGISRPPEKTDSDKRINYSKQIKKYLEPLDEPKIIGGDFNLLPNTTSIKIFEEGDYKNLIKDFNIRTTRNNIAWKKYPENKQYFSDYVFVNSKVKVKTFKVPYCEISDHLPLELDFNII